MIHRLVVNLAINSNISIIRHIWRCGHTGFCEIATVKTAPLEYKHHQQILKSGASAKMFAASNMLAKRDR